MKRALIDYSAFVGKDDSVIIKELTVIDIDTLHLQHWVFAPPKESGFTMPKPHHNMWLSKHFHGLSFDVGTTDYSALNEVLNHYCDDAQQIFTPSVEKATEIEKRLFPARVVFALETLGCPTQLQDTLCRFGKDDCNDDIKQCLLHKLRSPNFYCTQSNAGSLARWCRDNLDKLDMTKEENRLKTFYDWTHESPTAITMAAAGFVRKHDADDTTKCVYCGVCLHKWLEGDVPLDDHEYNAPYCKYVKHIRKLEEESAKVKPPDSKQELEQNSDVFKIPCYS